jgi:amino acid transporter
MAKKTKKEEKDSPGGLFIPAGVLLGMGLGFIFGNIPAWLFIGLGTGFLAFAISELIKKH